MVRRSRFSPPVPDQSQTSAAGTRKRPILEHAWLGAVIAWAAFRIAIAGSYLSRFGVNTWLFAAVELSSSVLYGLASGRAVTGFVRSDRRAMRRWVPPAVFGFFAPDLFVAVTARRAPIGVWVVLVAVVATSTVLTVRRVRRTKQANRRARAGGPSN